MSTLGARDSGLCTQNSVLGTYRGDVVRHLQTQRLHGTSVGTGRHQILEVGLKTGIPMDIVALRKTNRSQFETRPYLEINDRSPQRKVGQQDL